MEDKQQKNWSYRTTKWTDYRCNGRRYSVTNPWMGAFRWAV